MMIGWTASVAVQQCMGLAQRRDQDGIVIVSIRLAPRNRSTSCPSAASAAAIGCTEPIARYHS